MKIIYRGAYATFPAASVANMGDLAYATDLLVLFISNSTAWIPYHDYPDYEGNKSGLYSIGYWAAREGCEIVLQNAGVNQAFGATINATRTPAAGRTFYITDVSFYAVASNAADGDKNQFAALVIFLPFPGTIVLALGGNGGRTEILERPIRVDAGVTVTAMIYAYANHDIDMGFTVGGYEI